MQHVFLFYFTDRSSRKVAVCVLLSMFILCKCRDDIYLSREECHRSGFYACNNGIKLKHKIVFVLSFVLFHCALVF